MMADSSAEALAAAIVVFEKMRDWASPENSHRFIREDVMARYARSAKGMLHLTVLAEHGDQDAHQVLTDLAAEYLNRGEALPSFLATYVARGMYGLGPARRGKKKADYLLRDISITVVVGDLAMHFGLRPTRNGRQARPSACSIVAEALGRAKVASVKEKAVERIYNRYWGAVRPTNPDYRPSLFEGQNTPPLLSG